MERLRVLDASFLHLEDDHTPMHIASLCTFEGPAPSQEEVKRLFAAKMNQIPRYRRRVRFLPLELGRPVWVDDPHFDLDYHLRRTALPAPGDDAALCTLMGRLMSQLLDRSRPLWEVWVVEGLEGGRWALVSKIHHAMVDGVSGVELTNILLDSEPTVTLGPPATWIADPEPSPLAKVIDAWLGLAADLRHLAQSTIRAIKNPVAGAHELIDMWAGLDALTRRLLTTRLGALQGPVGKHRSYAHASTSMADVQLIRKALGGTVNDVVLAAVSAGYRALLMEHGANPATSRVRSLVPVSTRAPGEKGILDNRVAALLCDLPVHIADPVERLQAVRTQMQELKGSHMAEAGAWATAVADLAPPFVVGALTRLATRLMHDIPQRALATVTTNVPGPRQTLWCLGHKMLEWHPYVPIGQGIRVSTAILSYDGRLGFGITSDYDSLRDASVLARGTLRGMEELLAAATACPVDWTRPAQPPGQTTGRLTPVAGPAPRLPS